MFRGRPAARLGGALFAAALLTSSLAQPATAATDTGDVPQSFTADSGDSCVMGRATGTIVWHLAPAGRSVDGTATVIDRPVPNDPAVGCRDDGRLTVLTLTAYASGVMVDRAAVEADNGAREADFQLVAGVPVESVVVQVCRRGRLPGPPTYCGTPQTYRAPVTITG